MVLDTEKIETTGWRSPLDSTQSVRAAVASLAGRPRAVFLDRDGTLVTDHQQGKTVKPKILPFVVDGLKRLSAKNYLLIVITNQPDIARGKIKFSDVIRFNRDINDQLTKTGVTIDGFYVCPHHPKDGKSAPYTRSCSCRKPMPGLLLQAAADFNIDLEESFMVGDYVWDIQAGKAAGVQTILVHSSKRMEKDITAMVKTSKPDYDCKTFADAARCIIQNK
jgi:D-glycero-D-manno-heptose 1,7-bisphosphate phosphatase